MKTRSNMPLFVVECSDIKALSNSQIDLLRCGDYLVKKDGSGEHAYKVSFKKDGVGICLTYCDGSGYIETASYDYTDGNWVFNSLDVFNGVDLQGVKQTISQSPQEVLEALQNQDLKVKTIEQSEANFELDISDVAIADLDAGLEYEPIYERFLVFGNILYIVLCFKYNNTTETPITASSNASLKIELPTEIASKIYDLDGKNVHETNAQDISADFMFRGDTSYPDRLNRGSAVWTISNTNQSNKLSINLLGTTASIPASGHISYSFRTFLTLH